MIQLICTVQNKNGIHARPASAIVGVASKFDADTFLEKDGSKVSAKSIMSVMMLAAQYGSQLIVHADGDDAHEAAAALVDLFDSKFGEE